MKKYLNLLNANKRTILGLVGVIALFVLSIVETYSSSTIASEIQYIIITFFGFFNLRGVMGRGFESVEKFLEITQKAVDDVEELIDTPEE
ncbi:hypothetical protein RJG79_00045 [Mycoplasmatota bacterium WC44]